MGTGSRAISCTAGQTWAEETPLHLQTPNSAHPKAKWAQKNPQVPPASRKGHKEPGLNVLWSTPLCEGYPEGDPNSQPGSSRVKEGICPREWLPAFQGHLPPAPQRALIRSLTGRSLG